MKNLKQRILVSLFLFSGVSCCFCLAAFSENVDDVHQVFTQQDWTRKLDRLFFARPGYFLFINRWPTCEQTDAGISLLVDRFVHAASVVKPRLTAMLQEMAPNVKKLMSSMCYLLSHATLRGNMSEFVADKSCIEVFLPELDSLAESERIAAASRAILSESEQLVVIVQKYFPEARDAAAQCLHILYGIVSNNLTDMDASDLLSEGKLLLSQLSFTDEELLALHDATKIIDASELVPLPLMTPVPMQHLAVEKPSMVVFCNANLGYVDDNEEGDEFSLPTVLQVQPYAAIYDITSNVLYTDLDVALCDEYNVVDGLKGVVSLEDEFVLGEPRMILGASVIIKKFSECLLVACDRSLLRRVDVIAVPACAKNFIVSWAKKI